MVHSREMDAIMDTAQQIVTAVLHGERGTAIELVRECPHPDVLALVTADLLAFVHQRWAYTVARHTGVEARRSAVTSAWAAIAEDIELNRSETRSR